MKPTVYDWLISLILHMGLISSLMLTQLTQQSKSSKPIIDAPVYWVSIENRVDTLNSVSFNNADAAFDTINAVGNAMPTKVATDTQQTTVKVTAKASVAAENKHHANNIVKQNVQPSDQTKTQKSAEIKAAVAIQSKPTLKLTAVKTSVSLSKPAVSTAKQQITTRSPTATTNNIAEKNNKAKMTSEVVNQPQAQPKTEQKTQNIAPTAALVAKTIAKTEPQQLAKPEANHKTENQLASKKVIKPDNSAQWQSQFVAAVNRNKSYPSTAKKAGIEGSVLIGVHVMASGQIHCYVKQGSGNAQLDDAAVQAANHAASSMGNQLNSDRDLSFDVYVDYVLDK